MTLVVRAHTYALNANKFAGGLLGRVTLSLPCSHAVAFRFRKTPTRVIVGSVMQRREWPVGWGAAESPRLRAIGCSGHDLVIKSIRDESLITTSGVPCPSILPP